MSEYITRQALLNAIPPTEEDKQISLYGAVADFIVMVNAIPAADVAPIIHSKWVYGEFDIPHCSECGHEVMPNVISPFCPNCGARMDGGVTNGEDH